MPKTVKGGHFEIFLTSILLHNFKKLKPDLKNFAKKNKKNEIFQQSHSAEKSERRDPLGFFNIRSVAKYQKNEGGNLWSHEKKCEKSHRAEITCTK